MDEAKITVLYDEGAVEGTTYIGGKGLSMLIEVDGERTLFGTGLRPRYLSNNLYVADVNPDSITRVVVSHGHPDHWAGITGLLRQRDAPLKLYATADAWGEKKFLGATGIYIPSEHSEKVQREDVAGWVQLSEHLFISQPMAFHSGNGNEIFIVLKSRNGPVLISGCCHCGIDHIFEAAKEKFGAYPVALLGGLHLLERKDKLADLYAQYLQTVGCRNLYLNHCTGVTGINRLRVTLGLKGVNDFYTGQSMTFQIF